MTFALRPTYRRQVALNRQPKLEHFDNLYGAFCLKKVVAAYGGPLVRLRRASDNVEADFSPGIEGWLSGSEVTTWLGGSSALITTMYDQSGNARDFTQSTSSNQPALDLTGSRPRMVTTATGEFLIGTSTLAGFARNQTAVSMVSVRIHDSTSGTQQVAMFQHGLDANTTRCRLAVASGNWNSLVRAIDAGSSHTNNNGAADTVTWITQAVVFNIGAGWVRHEVNGVPNTTTTTANTFSDTDSGGVFWGSRNDAESAAMKTTALLLFRDALTVSELAAVRGFCEDLKAA